MPRPKRYALREGNAVPETEEKPAVALGATQAAEPEGRRAGSIVLPKENPEGLDERGDSEPSSRRGLVSGETEIEVQRRVARKLGWVPQEEWTRDPAKWADADKFLENTPREVENLRERLKRNDAAAELALAAERRLAREEAERKIREAAKSGNPEEAVQAAKGLAAASGPDPRTVAWAARNSWFHSDPAAKALAVAVVNARAASGASHEDQLQAAEDEVKRRFPEHFGDYRRKETEADPDTRREARLSEVRPAPVMERGSRTGGGVGGQQKPKGWSDIPTDDRKAQSIFVRNFMRRGKSETEAQAILAREYWRNQGE